MRLRDYSSGDVYLNLVSPGVAQDRRDAFAARAGCARDGSEGGGSDGHNAPRRGDLRGRLACPGPERTRADAT